MKKIALVPIILTLFFASACGRNFIKYDPDQVIASNDKKEESLTFRAFWIKNKGKLIEFEYTLTNNYKFPIRLNNASFKLAFNGQAGVLATEDTPETLDAGQTIKTRMKFKFIPNVEKTGLAVLTIDPISKKVEASEKAKKTQLPALTVNMPVQK